MYCNEFYIYLLKKVDLSPQLYFVLGAKMHRLLLDIGHWLYGHCCHPEQFFLFFFHTISMLFPCYPQDILQHYFHVISLMMLATKAIILKQTIHWRKMACARGCYIYSHALKFFLTLTGAKSLFFQRKLSQMKVVCRNSLLYIQFLSTSDLMKHQ